MTAADYGNGVFQAAVLLFGLLVCGWIIKSIFKTKD